MKKKLFGRDFSLIVIGQVISLFGNAILRFALPLYLYRQTGSATLLGIVTAVSFIPMVLLAPVGGIIADRVNKRNVMVVLDFFTAALVLVFTILLGQVSLVPLITVAMMLLYGIQGSYQPAVQASLPALLDDDQLVSGNAVINTVSSLASLVGPVAGGVLFSFYGIYPILITSVVCLFLSAVMEIFIKIPFHKQPGGEGVLNIAKSDLKESARFIRRERPVIGKAMSIVAAFNLFLSAMVTVGSLVVITNLLGFEENLGAQLYGYTEGAMAAGGLLGGVLIGVLFKNWDISKGHLLLGATAVGILPMGIALALGLPSMVTYVIITICCFFIMACSIMFSILALAFIQQITPENLIGKVISLVMALSMCAAPLGQLLYGVLFDLFATTPYVPMLFAAVVSFMVALFSRAVFAGIREVAEPNPA